MNHRLTAGNTARREARSQRVDQKREDALLMFRTMRLQVRADATHHPVQFHFEHTTLWERASRLAAARDSQFEPA